jgi:ribosomal protein S3AE
MKKTKNLKISEDIHNLLKLHCEKKGLKIYKFIENIVLENCSEKIIKHKKDIYGE